jgi:hypothetical protein
VNSWSRRSPAGLDRALAGHLDGEPVAQRGDQRLGHRGDLLAVALDGERLAQLEPLLLDLQELLAVGGLQDVGVAQAHDLAVDVEDALPAVVLDPESRRRAR